MMDTVDTETDELAGVKSVWLQLEQEKEALRTRLRDLTKKQRPLNDQLQDYMLSNSIKQIDMGAGWSLGATKKDRVTCSISICRNYMSDEQLDSMVRDNTSSKTCFKVSKPRKERGTKRARTN